MTAKYLGLPESCFASDCNRTSFFNASRGQRCFSTACDNTFIERNGWGPGVGFGPCWKRKDSPFFPGAIAYLVFSICVAAMAAGLSVMLIVMRVRTFLDMVAAEQLPAMWPSLGRLAEEQDRPLEAVLRRYTSVFMCLECSATGDAASAMRRFTYLPEGCQGALVHAAYVITVALPLHIFGQNAQGASEVVRGGPFPGVCAGLLCAHYAIQLIYAVGYYLRVLPFRWVGGLLPQLYIWLTRFFFFMGLLLIYIMLLWTLSAIYFDQARVISILTLFGSLAYFIVNAASVIKRYTKMVQSRVEHMREEARNVLAAVDSTASTMKGTVSEMKAIARRKGQHMRADVSKLRGVAERGQPLNVPDAAVAEESATLQPESEPQEGGGRGMAEVLAEAGDSLQNSLGAMERASEAFGLPGELGHGARSALAASGMMLAGGVQALDVAERGAKASVQAATAYAEELQKLGLAGKELYATMVTTAVLMILASLFVLLGQDQWQGNGGLLGVSPSNGLVPLIAYFSSRKTEEHLQNADDSAE